MTDKPTSELNRSARRKVGFWWWYFPELVLHGGIFLLGVLILGIHLWTWNPSSVDLDKDLSFWGWWFLLIPVTLIFFGAGGLLVSAFTRSRSKEQRRVAQHRQSLYPMVPDTERTNESPGTELAIRLPLVSFPVLQTVTGLVLAILWNVLAWVVFFSILSIQKDRFDLILAILFGLVFCGTGLVFLPWFIARFRAAFGIGTTILEISDHPIWPGRKYRLALLQSGRLHASRYRVSVLSEEVTRYRQGTDTLTNRKEVFEKILFSRDDLSISADQTVHEDFFLEIPIGAMHSMTAEYNQIHWKIVIDIEVTPTLKLRRECPLIVMPLAIPE